MPFNNSFSVASSTGSNHGTVSADSTLTESDFNPARDEIFASTEILDSRDFSHQSRKLPELRDTAKKYARWEPRPQSEYVLNTSALSKAFPNFSSAGSDDTFSVEVGRAPTRLQTNINNSNQHQGPRVEYSGPASSPLVTINGYKLNHTPKRSELNRLTSMERKENVPPPSTQKSAKDSPYVSYASRTISGEQRTLTELQAHVADDSDNSFLGQNRPSAKSLQAKNTRFSSGQTRPQRAPISSNVSSKRQPFEDETPCKPSQQKPRAHKQAQAAVAATYSITKNDDLRAQEKPKTTHTENTTGSITHTTTPNPTVLSFCIPGVNKDTSIAPNGIQASVAPTFAHGSAKAQRSKSKDLIMQIASFGPVSQITVPDDEEDIYEFIEALKARVTRVETQNTQQQNELNHIKDTNIKLAHEKRELEDQIRADSGLDLGEGDNHGKERREAESGRVASYVSLQSLLLASQRRVSDQSIKLRTNEAEKETAMRRLTEAHKHINDLENALKAFEDEKSLAMKQAGQAYEHIAQLEKKLNTGDAEKASAMDQATGAYERIAKLEHKLETSEADKASAIDQTAEERKRYKQLNNQFSQYQEEVQQYIDNLRHELSTEAEQNIARLEDEKANLGKAAKRQKAAITKIKSLLTQLTARCTCQNIDGMHDTDHSLGNASNAGTVVHNVEETIDGSDFDDELGEGWLHGIKTHVRALGDKGAIAQSQKDDTGRFSVHSARSQAYTGRLSAREEMNHHQIENHEPALGGTNAIDRDQEDVTGRFSIHSVRSHRSLTQTGALSVREESAGHQRDQSKTHRRHHSEASVVHSKTHHEVETDDMTSAFIIPDIEIGSQKHAKQRKDISKQTNKVLEKACPHNKHSSSNCLICFRILSVGDKTKLKDIQASLQIPKPIPVSQRMPVPDDYEDEPTIRPAEDPNLALARVIKDTEDEIFHLKQRRAEIQALYDTHDASLSKRKRKALAEKLQELAVEIEAKSDRLYSLFDVLEGRKY
ncbi:hypothetical protein B0J14DRAFT_607563 [Halenospora varia]|nr:hypothetical protein B0J14DRAFT_607563 [Halenospora varia]